MTIASGVLYMNFESEEIKAVKKTISIINNVSHFFNNSLTDIQNGDFVEKEELARVHGILEMFSENDKFFSAHQILIY